MTPRDQNILATLNILVLVFRSQKHMFPKRSEKMQHTLQITQEHLAQAGINIPVFINTLQELANNGYLLAGNSVFESKYHDEFLKVLDDVQYEKIQTELEKVDTSELEQKLKILAADMLEKTAPAYIPVDREEVMKEDVSMKSLLEEFREAYKGYTPDVVSVIILSPFRSVERLLEQVNAGIRFDDVKDEGIWYEPSAYEFHFDDTVVSTGYQGKPNKEHFALQALFNQFEEPRIDYTDIPEFDKDNKEKSRKAYFDALNRFIKKHSRLSEIFSVHSDALVIHESYLGHSH